MDAPSGDEEDEGEKEEKNEPALGEVPNPTTQGGNSCIFSLEVRHKGREGEVCKCSACAVFVRVLQ